MFLKSKTMPVPHLGGTSTQSDISDNQSLAEFPDFVHSVSVCTLSGENKYKFTQILKGIHQ